jgi:hypothetical protein
MRLTDQQIRFFKTFGYVIMPKLFSAGEIEEITAGFEKSIQQHGGGDKHDGSKRTMFLGPIERIPEMNRLLDEPRPRRSSKCITINRRRCFPGIAT